MYSILMFLLFLIFFSRNILFVIGAFIEKLKNSYFEHPDYNPFVSVIVPARNEENNIERCINSIMMSSYPAKNFELIVVNDRSTDSTGIILEGLKDKYTNLIIYTVTENNRNKNLQGKAGALQSGIETAKGEIVLMTDADCIVNTDWIKTVVSYYSDDNVAMVPAFTIIDDFRPFQRIQAIEWIFMHSMASAGIALNQPLGCYGNNLSIRRKVYNDMGGYEKIKFSVTEDLALVQATYKTGKKIKYLCSEASSVITYPVENFLEYIKQRHRWAIGGMGLRWRAVVFVICTVAMWINLLLSIIFKDPLWFTITLSARILGDFALEFPSFVALKRKRFALWSIPATLFFMFMELVVPLLLLKKSVVWKGQVFRK